MDRMRIFKTRHFAKWARKHAINDQLLAIAIDEKNERANINDKEKRIYKALVAAMLAFNENDIEERLQAGSLIEVES